MGIGKLCIVVFEKRIIIIIIIIGIPRDSSFKSNQSKAKQPTN